MSASPEMAALVDAFGVASVEAVNDPALGEWADTRERLTVAIAKLEAARDEATRRLAVVEEAVRAARDLLNSDANGGWAAKATRAVVVLNNALEKQP